MIFIDRNRRDNRNRLIAPTGRWFLQARRATQRAIREGNQHNPQRSIYSHASVRTALEKLFFSKCAYCEVELPATDWPVDHFRPGGRVKEDGNHPGYYWLLYEWGNLYPACFQCNGPRKDPATWEDRNVGRTAGKWDHFPLTGNDTRARTPQDNIEAEERLLLDPCKDDPSEFMSYSLDGAIFAISDNPKGETTIRILNLNRKRDRMKRKHIIVAVVELLGIRLSLEERGNTDIAFRLTENLEKWLTGVDRPYAAAARSVERDPSRFGI